MSAASLSGTDALSFALSEAIKHTSHHNREHLSLPLELWYHIFQCLDLPARGICIAHWPGRVPEIGGFETREDSLLFRALTSEDVLFPGSGSSFWKWLVPNVTWRVHDNTDLWRLTRLEKSVGAMVWHVVFELNLTGPWSNLEKQERQAKTDLENLDVIKELPQLRTFDVNIMFPVLFEGTSRTAAVLQGSRQIMGDVLVGLGRALPTGTGGLNIWLYSTSSQTHWRSETDHDQVDYYGYKLITDTWFNCLNDSEQLEREISQLYRAYQRPPSSSAPSSPSTSSEDLNQT